MEVTCLVVFRVCLIYSFGFFVGFLGCFAVFGVLLVFVGSQNMGGFVWGCFVWAFLCIPCFKHVGVCSFWCLVCSS